MYLYSSDQCWSPPCRRVTNDNDWSRGSARNLVLGRLPILSPVMMCSITPRHLSDRSVTAVHRANSSFRPLRSRRRHCRVSRCQTRCFEGNIPLDRRVPRASKWHLFNDRQDRENHREHLNTIKAITPSRSPSMRKRLRLRSPPLQIVNHRRLTLASYFLAHRVIHLRVLVSRCPFDQLHGSDCGGVRDGCRASISSTTIEYSPGEVDQCHWTWECLRRIETTTEGTRDTQRISSDEERDQWTESEQRSSHVVAILLPSWLDQSDKTNGCFISLSLQTVVEFSQCKCRCLGEWWFNQYIIGQQRWDPNVQNRSRQSSEECLRHSEWVSLEYWSTCSDWSLLDTDVHLSNLSARTPPLATL